MVYLIDDKKHRQEQDYHWDDKLFDDYSHIIKPIYNLEELLENREQVFKNNNIVLYHESFLDDTPSSSISQQKRIELEKFAEKNPEFNLAIFSGSKFSRNIINNIAYLPVSVLYNNLATFINKVSKEEINLNYLLFGDSPLIEQKLSEKLSEALSKTIKEGSAKIEGKTNLVLRSVKNFIPNAIEGAEEKVLFNLSDQKLSEYIEKWLKDVEYDNIFIPLCFGSTLSDFNGLRLATHIRCSATTNQLSRIFIYGFAAIEDLLNHECFNILKTKNVELIPFSKTAIEKAGNSTMDRLVSSNLILELEKLKLNVPKDFLDNHAVANEYGIYQLAYNAGIDINEIKDFDSQKLKSLYFKWLIAKNGLQESLPIPQKKENKKYRQELKGTTLVGKIDLSKFK